MESNEQFLPTPISGRIIDRYITNKPIILFSPRTPTKLKKHNFNFDLLYSRVWLPINRKKETKSLLHFEEIYKNKSLYSN